MSSTQSGQPLPSHQDAVDQCVVRVRAVVGLQPRDPTGDVLTNAIESLKAGFRPATRARGFFPNEQAAMKCLYLVVRSLDPKGTDQERWMNRSKPAFNAFAITFEGRLF